MNRCRQCQGRFATVVAVRPWVTALNLTLTLPAAVRRPVLLAAFLLLASVFAWLIVGAVSGSDDEGSDRVAKWCGACGFPDDLEKAGSSCIKIDKGENLVEASSPVRVEPVAGERLQDASPRRTVRPLHRAASGQAADPSRHLEPGLTR